MALGLSKYIYIERPIPLHLHLGALAPEKKKHLIAGLHILSTHPHVEENGLEGVCVHAPLVVVGCGLLIFHLPCIRLANSHVVMGIFKSPTWPSSGAGCHNRTTGSMPEVASRGVLGWP